jgi:hypothetical protein
MLTIRMTSIMIARKAANRRVPTEFMRVASQEDGPSLRQSVAGSYAACVNSL